MIGLTLTIVSARRAVHAIQVRGRAAHMEEDVTRPLEGGAIHSLRAGTVERVVGVVIARVWYFYGTCPTAQLVGASRRLGRRNEMKGTMCYYKAFTSETRAKRKEGTLYEGNETT